MGNNHAKNHYGNETRMHNFVKNTLVYYLGRKYRRDVWPEYDVPNMDGTNSGMSIVDVADRTDKAHPLFFEVETAGRTPRFKTKQRLFAERLGKDLHLVDVPRMLSELGTGDPGPAQVERWLEGEFDFREMFNV